MRTRNDGTYLAEPGRLVSVIVVNYNGMKVIGRCLDSILRSSYKQLEVIVVDNASTDGSAQYLSRRYKKSDHVVLVICERNLGFAAGSNLGAHRANGEYLFFLNFDTKAMPSAVGNLVSILEGHPSVAAAQSKLLMMSDRKKLDSAGDFICTVGWPYSRGKGIIDRGQYDSKREIFSARGAAMLVRERVFHEVDGFDADYFMYYEDIDLSWRLRLRGYSIEFAASSVVYHIAGAASGKQVHAMTVPSFYSGRNYIATLVKNFESRSLLTYGLGHLMVQVATILYLISKRRAHEAFGFTVALLAAVKDFRKNWKKRVIVQSIRLVSDDRILKHARRMTLRDLLRGRDYNKPE
ncbi:MAG: glycosyltransferase family 2 protein [Candidatus Bathyarchaeia archaeon]